MAAPQGKIYEYNGRTYELQPTLLSTRGQQIVKRKLVEIHERTCDRMLQMAERAGPKTRAELVERAYKGFSPLTAHVIGAIDQPEVLPFILTAICPQLEDIDEARRFVDSHDNFSEISQAVFLSCSFDAVGNLHRLIGKLTGRDPGQASNDGATNQPKQSSVENGRPTLSSTSTSPESMGSVAST